MLLTFKNSANGFWESPAILEGTDKLLTSNICFLFFFRRRSKSLRKVACKAFTHGILHGCKKPEKPLQATPTKTSLLRHLGSISLATPMTGGLSKVSDSHTTNSKTLQIPNSHPQCLTIVEQTWFGNVLFALVLPHLSCVFY